MAEEFFRSNTNLKPSEIKAAFERSRNIDAQLDKERENKEREIQLLTLGMYAVFFFFASFKIPLLISVPFLVKYFNVPC